MIIDQLKLAQFSEDEHELSVISARIIHKCEMEKDTYFSKEDYEKLLSYYLNKNDEKSIQAMVSPVLIQLLKHDFYIKFAEENKESLLYEVQEKLLISQIKEGRLENVKSLLASSTYCRSIINKNLSIPALREMLPGATLLQFALKHGQIEVANFLIDSGADINVVDYYDNSILHYGAMGGQKAFEYAKALGCTTSKNIFGYEPEAYLDKKIELLKINQRLFIDKFTAYMKVNKYDENVLMTTQDGNAIKISDLIYEMNEGLCSGDGFIKSINIIRGEKSINLNTKISNAIRRWDGSMYALDQKLDDPDLAKEFSNLTNPTLRSLFEYMISVTLASQPYSLIPIIDNQYHDTPAMFDLLKNKNDKDKLNQITKHDSVITTKNDFKRELGKMLSGPNILVNLSLGDWPKFKNGHTIFVVTDKDNNIHLIDSNSPYEIPALKNEADTWDKIGHIVFSYYGKVNVITAYQYTPALEIKLQYGRNL